MENACIGGNNKRMNAEGRGSSKKVKKMKKVAGETPPNGESDFVPPRGTPLANPGPQHFQGKNESRKGSSKSPKDVAVAATDEGSDEWQTCRESWSDIATILSVFKKQRVWMPFYYDGVCASYMRDLGFKSVYHKKRDFFSLAKDPSFLSQVDVIIDNPPYTGEETKAKVLSALKATNKPFCMLLPMTVLHSALLREVLGTTKVQAVIPRRVLVRKATPVVSAETGKSGALGGGGSDAPEQAAAVPFKYLVWLCYRMDLKKDLYFV
mmetsp:Transcript_59348/g.119084  ORF Transcript_59348/g.119084 Transcript_59348/m.119084 type:complete len:266 (+) Transcript_59348:118-915(+)